MDTDETRYDLPGGSDTAPGAAREFLSDPHVRYLLEYLRRTEGPVDLPTLATHVAAGVTDTPPEDVPGAVRDRVQTFLHHGHLPVLARYGVVEFDREANSVALDG